MQKVAIELKILKFLTNQKLSSLSLSYRREDYKLKEEYGQIVSKLDIAKKDFK
jgi:hypothetical protein